MADRPSEIAARVLAGDRRAVARAISLIEDEAPAGERVIAEIFGRTGRACLVGVTGPAGAGKSTLVDRLATLVRRSGQTVGIVAVDPSSPFTGGALLGDRVRMQSHAGDAGVFIRSMATRGHLGGLARATGDAALVLDAAGSDVVIIETVGVGQDEVDVVRTADLSIVVLVPESGDDVQALKAGLMEIADIFVINKADREGADRLVAAVESVLGLEHFEPGRWRPPVLKTEATTGTGVEQVFDAVAGFRAHDHGSAGARRRARSEHRLRQVLVRRFLAEVEDEWRRAGELSDLVDRIARREIDPYSAAALVLEKRLGRAPQRGSG